MDNRQKDVLEAINELGRKHNMNSLIIYPTDEGFEVQSTVSDKNMIIDLLRATLKNMEENQGKYTFFRRERRNL